MTNRDTRSSCDTQLLLYILCSSFRDTRFDFWAAILSQHNIMVGLTNVSVFRNALLHLFSGACALHGSPGCKTLVTSEQSPHQTGVDFIDATLGWLESGDLLLLNVNRFVSLLGCSLQQ